MKGRGEKFSISQSPTLKIFSDGRGRALKSRGVAPQKVLSESGGGSWQKSHGDPCCGAQEPGKEFK